MAAQTSRRPPAPGWSSFSTSTSTAEPDRGCSRRSGLIDLVFDGLDSPWAVEILRGVEEWGAEQWTAIAVSSVRHGDARPASWTSTIASHHSDGVILVTTKLTDTQVRTAPRGGHPARRHRPGQHAAGRTSRPSGRPTGRAGSPPPSTCSPSATGGSPRSPARPTMLCSLARLDGYRSGLERAGVAFDPALVRYGDFHHEGGFGCASELLGLRERPTAIFAGSDQQAFGVYEAARQHGLRIPEDLSVVGFDELPVARWASPPMTTVRQPLAEMGNAAARMLGELIDGVPLRSSRMELTTELIVRESTAAPKAASATPGSNEK